MPRKARTNPEKVQAANEAAQVFEAPIFKEVMANIRENLINDWENSDILDGDKREVFWASLQALNQIQSQLDLLIKDGNYAAKLMKNVTH
jgi:hypothetical protein